MYNLHCFFFPTLSVYCMHYSESERENRDTDDVSEVERSYFRGEFLRIMQEKFLSGEDTNFDYRFALELWF